MESFTVRTRRRNEFVDITREVAEAVSRSGVREGICLVYIPHTTCGVTVNENADPDVPSDILSHTAQLVPREGLFRHAEGNSDAHIKASLFGASALVPVTGGRLALGTWQAVFLCEFDGGRTRKVYVQVLAGGENAS